MTEPLRPGRRFDHDQTPDRGPAETERLATNRQFDATLPVTSGGTIDEDVDAALTERPKHRKLLWLLVGVALLATAELVAVVIESVAEQGWLSLGWSLLGLGAIAVTGRVLWRELRRLRNLRHHVALRDQAETLRFSDANGASLELCRALRKTMDVPRDDLRWQRFLGGDQPHHSDRERLQRYSRHLLGTRDADARRLVTRAATDVALVVAISPLAWIDMAMMGWRTARLLERIGSLYGLELGYGARIRLFRSLLTNMALAGAGEIASDVAADLVALGVAGKVSTRVAQGLAAGLLTARFGLRALASCRPLPFEEEERPRLSELRRELLDQLRHAAVGAQLDGAELMAEESKRSASTTDGARAHEADV